MSGEVGDVGEIRKTGEIKRQPPKGILDRVFARLGYDVSEYSIPNKLDQRIKQPFEVDILLWGPKDNLAIFFQNKEVTVSFNDLSPEGTTFKVHEHEDKDKGFTSTKQGNAVKIPYNLHDLADDTALGLLHEISHCWIIQNSEWNEKYRQAEKILGVKVKKMIPTEDDLSRDKEQRKKELEAWKIVGENERNAYAFSLYILGKFRSMNIDLLPQYPNTDNSMRDDVNSWENKSLFLTINANLGSHSNFGQRIKFTEEEFQDFLAGRLPFPSLKEKIDAQITKSLTHTKTTEEEPLKV